MRDTRPDSHNEPARRRFLRHTATAGGALGALSMFPPAIRQALAIPADRRTGTIDDVAHIVVLMQENRSFDHYFGTMPGVRGFADRFPIPVRDAPGLRRKTVWLQRGAPAPLPQGQTAPVFPAPSNGRPWPLPPADGPVVAPFHLDTERQFELMRVEGTPHSWWDAQFAWDHGRMNWWTRDKQDHSMGHYAEQDLPFQWAMANAFTLCDAYHCSFQGGTNTNRLFQWTGTNDPHGLGNGPAIYNDYDDFPADPGNNGGYTWLTYTEMLERAGVSWQVYQNMDDNFTDNPLAGFQSFRAAHAGAIDANGASASLRERGVSTRDLDMLRQDVQNGTLPQVSFIVATAAGSEHPGPSSPAQGADYTARVLDALTSNPAVWSRCVLFVNFDENDGFFDHVPPPAVPSIVGTRNRRRGHDGTRQDDALMYAGDSTVSTDGEYHRILLAYHQEPRERSLLGNPYGLGPRVPMYVISPWSRGGWVNSEVADHTSVIRFIERRFGVVNPLISPWRRAVCGDLTSAFNFADPDDSEFFARLPATLAQAERARALPRRTTPVTPSQVVAPVQGGGVRPSRALGYAMHVTASPVRSGRDRGHDRDRERRDRDHDRDRGSDDHARGHGGIALTFHNTGSLGVVFHVYDRLDLDAVPRRYTVEPGLQLAGRWDGDDEGRHDLWVLGPNGFHRHFTGRFNGSASEQEHRTGPEIIVTDERDSCTLVIRLCNHGSDPCDLVLTPNAYFDERAGDRRTVVAGGEETIRRSLETSSGWYDFSVTSASHPGFSRRFAGRLETGRDSISDPAMEGPAVLDQWDA